MRDGEREKSTAGSTDDRVMTVPYSSERIRKVAVPCPLCKEEKFDPVARSLDFECLTTADEFSVVRCRCCGVLYLNPRPALDELERIYPRDYPAYHFDAPHLTYRFRSWLEKRKVLFLARKLPPSANILDVGCGGYGFLEKLREFGPRGWRLWGNDISENVLADLKKRGFGTLSGKFEEIDRPPASLDAIIFKQVLEHFESPGDILIRSAKLLRPDGLVMIETPNSDALDSRLFRTRYWAGYHIPRHWVIFDTASLRRLGKQAGFEVEELSYIASPHFWVESVRNILMDRGWPPMIYKRFTNRNLLTMSAGTLADVTQKLFSGKTSNMRVILRKAAR